MQREKYLTEEDTGPLNNRYDGFRVVYNHTLDLNRAFPDRAPTAFDLNPLTGHYWTAAELEMYPRGYPGWPERTTRPFPMTEAERIGFPTGPSQGGRGLVPMPATGHFDRSHFALSWLLWTGGARPTGPGHPTQGWRWPNSVAEVDKLFEIAHHPCNLDAYNHWGEYLQYASRIPSSERTDAMNHATQKKHSRPSWAPYRPTKTKFAKSRSQARRRDRAREESAAAEETAPATTTELEEGQVQETDVQMSDVTPDNNSQANAASSTIAQDETPTEPRFPAADIHHSAAWVVALRDNPDVTFPGITRLRDGMPSTTTTVRGMLRIASSGPDIIDPEAEIMRRYLNVVVEILSSTPSLHLPSLSESPARFVGEINADNVLAHLEAQQVLMDYDEHQEITRAEIQAWVDAVRSSVTEPAPPTTPS